MQFIANGPNIPERLIQAQQEGRLVFFCGAGISYPAGLASFAWLVDELYKRVPGTRTTAQLKALEEKRFDAALALLERDTSHGRETVRNHLPEILRPNLRRRDALKTHRALLNLAKNKDDRTRLITTNFDRLFVRADPRVPHLSAPHLPIPKNSRWDGVVYLHGLIDERPTLHNLNHLVLTSGDFGLAYLTERWASRFVSDLFQKYTVCFAGYSADDLVLRYMLDALSADEQLGEAAVEVFAFAGTTAETRLDDEASWEAKRVTPISYDAANGHAAFHQTLWSWASTYRDGLNGRRGVALREAKLTPAKVDESGSAGRLMWALNEPTGEVARAFATAEPAPSIAWLDALLERRFSRADLPSFGISASQLPERGNAEDDLKFSLLSHPAAPRYAPWTGLVGSNGGHFNLDNPTIWLAEWLCRHLDKRETVLWVAESGGNLHPRFAQMVRDTLHNVTLPDAYRRIWEIISAGFAASDGRAADFNDWCFRLREGKIGTVSRLQFHALLEPRVSFRAPFRLPETPRFRRKNANARAPRIHEIVDFELHLTGDHPHDALDSLAHRPDWPAFLISSLPQFTELLKQCVDIMVVLDSASSSHDLSIWHQPSIEPHHQNSRFHAWTALIDLCRSAWALTAVRDPEGALLAFNRWRAINYIVFRRLALHAAATSEVISADVRLKMLLDEKTFWSEDSKHEVIQLLKRVSLELHRKDRPVLVGFILKGPPRKLFPARISASDWEYVRDQMIWARLSKWRETGAPLPASGSRLLKKLESAHPDWIAIDSERREFTNWRSSGLNELRRIAQLPRDVDKLIEVLSRRKVTLFATDDWGDICANEPALAKAALIEMASRGMWISSVWRTALNAASDQQSPSQLITITEFGHVIETAPSQFFIDTAATLPWWLRQSASNVNSGSLDSFLRICLRVIESVEYVPLEETDDPFGQAINHAAGRTAEAVLGYWYSTGPKVEQGLEPRIIAILDKICGSAAEGLRPGLVILASQLSSLYLVDPSWSKENLLPRLDWEVSPSTAAACWEGYLTRPRIDLRLFSEFKRSFLETSAHYANLPKHADQYASLLVWTAIEVAGDAEVDALKVALGALPGKGLACAAEALSQTVVNRGDMLTDYLEHRVKRIYPGAWPTSAKMRSDDEAQAIALFCVRTGDHFESWQKTSRPFLSRIRVIFPILKELNDTSICENFPEAVLEFLDRIVADDAYGSENLKPSLDALEKAAPRLVRQRKFIRLKEITERRR
ncbi:SIR2 family protein [Paraburkholderia sp. JHI869]|uniref:SIR2 family protein n=1 Tax=Paraburkholderia sp. JHI869 TaxID=3112959 RepID=UPI00317A4F94